VALTRRAALALPGGLLAGRAAAATTTDATGLPAQPWFLQSFQDLREDLEAAAAAGKRLAVLVEQRGCPYCKLLHEVNFADPAVGGWIRERFEILQLDLHGARPVTDLDGTVLEERAFARGATGTVTPAALFLPATLALAAGRPARLAAVARMPGYLPPREFLALFRWVAEEGYRHESLDAMLRRQS
jgi:thioredoxin-related protein